MNKVGQAFLILVLDLGKLFPEGLVIGKGLQDRSAIQDS